MYLSLEWNVKRTKVNKKRNRATFLSQKRKDLKYNFDYLKIICSTR